MTEQKITVTKEFRAAFKKVMDKYEVTGDELEFEKARCRANYEEAERNYIAIAKNLNSNTKTLC